jgi:HK97 family phage portal protein
VPILDSLLSAFGLERKARPAARQAVPGSSGSSGAIPLSGWSAGYGYSGGYGSTSPVSSPFADTVPWHLNPVVAAGIAWFARNFPVPDLYVVQDGGADDGAEIDGHDLPKLFDKPNELWSFFDFFAASVMSDITDGNTFWLKRKDGKGAVVDLWWLEPWGVRIMADPTRQKAVLGYRYDSGDVHADYRPDEILHVRAAQPDRVDPRRGMSPLSPVDRSIRVTTELCRYDEAILKNGGASPGVFVPPDPKQPIPKEDVPGLQAWYRQNQTGPNAGGPIFAPFGLQFLKTGFSPEEMSLDKLPRRHVSFILAAMGLSPMVLGYEDESKTYANFAEACRAAYENALMPMQARFAEAINHDENLIGEGERLKWKYDHVTYLQDDRGAKIHSLVEAVGGGILDANEARAELHYEPKEEEPEPEPPAQPPPVPGADGTAGTADGSAAPADIAALLAARGGGNGQPGNGKVPAGANRNGNGKPARPAAKALPGPAEPPTDADLARRTEAVLVALEAKLLGGRSHKAGGGCGTGAGGFKPGNTCGRGGGSHGGGGSDGPRVTQEEADAARQRLAGMGWNGGEHTLEFGPPETARDHKALEKADAAGKSVVVRATTTPDVRAETDGDLTHHLVAEQLVATVLPHPEKPDRWIAREHGTGARERYDDHEFRSKERADRQAESVVRSWVKGSSSTTYSAASRLERVNFESHEVGKGYRVNFRVLVPEGEPSVNGAGAGGASHNPFDPAPAIAEIKALYRAGRLSRESAILAIKAVRRGACRDRWGRFASCGTGSAASQDVRHERDTRPGGTRAARELVTGAGEHAGAETPKPGPKPKPEPVKPPEPPKTPLEAGQAAIADAMAKQREAAVGSRAKVVPHIVSGKDIRERLDKYEVGKVKVEHALKIADHHEAKIKELDAERKPILDRMKSLAEEQNRLIEPYFARGKKAPPEVKARNKEIQAEFDTHQARLDPLNTRRESVIKRRDGEIRQLLAADAPTPVNLSHTKGLKDSSGRKMAAPIGPTGDSINEGSSYVGGLLHNATGAPLETGIGIGTVGSRAHFSPDHDYIRVAPFDSPGVTVHELGHAIENKVVTGGVPLSVRVREFRDYRVGDEQPQQLNKVLAGKTLAMTRFDDSEMGVKDHFDRALPEERAWYAGKTYKSGDTEIVSMGLEALHHDPVNFIRKDPEYASFIMGVMDGSLR